MRLNDYLKDKDRGEFAARLGVSKGHIDNLCSNSRYAPSRKLAKAIEEITSGVVSIRELLYPENANEEGSRESVSPAS
jgi:DNA-binding transcriptional regulator YdaS (Cro superfamily)